MAEQRQGVGVLGRGGQGGAVQAQEGGRVSKEASTISYMGLL